MKLQDQLSPGMTKAADVADKTASKIAYDINRIASHTRGTVTAINELSLKLDKLDNKKFAENIVDGFRDAIREARKLENETDRIRRSSLSMPRSGGGGIGSIISGVVGGNLITGAITSGASMLVNGAKDLIGGAIGKSMEFGQKTESFKVLAGADKGTELAKQLNKMQQDTILGPEVFSAAQTMLGFGIASDKVLPSLKQLGDVSMGDSERLKSLTLAFSQVQAAGRLTGQDLLQFVNAGFNPLQQISKDTGLSLVELKKKMEDGAISAQMISDAFEHATGEGGQFNNMLSKLAETPMGKWQKLKGGFESTMTQLGKAFEPLTNIGLDFLNKLLDKAQIVIPWITEKIKFISDLLHGNVRITGQWGNYMEIAKGYLNAVWSTVKHVWGVISHIVKGVIDWVGKSELLKDIFSFLGKMGQTLYGFISKIADVIKWLWDKVISPQFERIEKLYRIAKELMNGGGINDVIRIWEQPIESAKVIQAPSQVVPSTKGLMILDTGDGAPKTSGASSFGGASAVGSSKAESINNGGLRSIVINIAKQVGVEEVHVMNGTEALSEIESYVKEVMRRALQSVNGMAVSN